jgi:APA family basic amino acid/polyamine antiporter
VVGVATVSLRFAGYFTSFIGLLLVLVAATLVLGLGFLTAWGIREPTRVAILLTLVEVGGSRWDHRYRATPLGSVDYLEMPSGFPGVFAGAALIFFAYQGFEEMVKLSEETRDPEKTIPCGLILALSLRSSSISWAVATVSAVDFNSLAAFPAPFAKIADTYLGSGGFTLFTIIALFATANTVLLTLIAASRLTYGMAKGGSLPFRFSSVHGT